MTPTLWLGLLHHDQVGNLFPQGSQLFLHHGDFVQRGGLQLLGVVVDEGMQRCGAALQDAGGSHVAEVGRERWGFWVRFPQGRCCVYGACVMQVCILGATSSEKSLQLIKK